VPEPTSEQIGLKKREVAVTLRAALDKQV